MIEPDGGVAGPTQRSSVRDRSGLRPCLTHIGRILTVCVVGSLIGLTFTYLAIVRGMGFGVVAAGPWTYRPHIGTMEIDPFSRAVLAHSGELPLGPAEGLTFLARSDSTGAPLVPGCDYLVTGNIPRARYWTLSLQSAEGDLIANASGRYGFTSAEILRSAGGGFEIIVARQARAGNWLPIGSDARFTLVLRLYDTEIDTRSTPPGATDMPRIEKLRCR